MTILRPAPISTRQLDYDPSTREWVGEISSTHGFGRVWNDSCDEGLTLVTGGPFGLEVVFVVCHTERDIDGDVAYWILEPADRRSDAARNGVSIRLFND